MRCKNCNENILDSAKHCTNCGNPMQLTQSSYTQEQAETNTRKSKVGIIVIIISVIVAVLIIFTVALPLYDGFNYNKTINNLINPTYDFPNSEKYSKIVDCGDGFYFVRQDVETYNSYEIYYGIVNKEGEFISKLSTDKFGDAPELSFMIKHIGENMFAFTDGCIYLIGDDGGTSGDSRSSRGSYSIYNADTEKFIDGGIEMSAYIGRYHDGYALYSTDKRIYKMDKSGEFYDLNIEANTFGPLSEGLFFVDEKKSLYDINGNLKLDLSEYDIYINSQNRYFMKDGKFYFMFFNPGGTRYHVEVDLTGKQLYSPKKMQ